MIEIKKSATADTRTYLTACEIDADYYAAAMARVKRETAQTTLFT